MRLLFTNMAPNPKIPARKRKPFSPKHAKPRTQKSVGKTMLRFLVCGGDAKDDLPRGKSLDGQYYADFLTKLRKDAIARA